MNQPPTPDAILQTGLAFWPAKTLLSAIELGVFTELASGAETLDGLRTRLGLHPRAARDFFDTLVALGFLSRDATATPTRPRPISSSIGASRRTSAASSRWPTPACIASGATSPKA